jgi:parvulin-like peptidyl-prolyl isomerase
MFIHKYLVAVLLPVTLIFAGCNGQPQKDQTAQGSKVLARVNGSPVTVEDVSFRLGNAHGEKVRQTSKSLDDIIDQELLYQQGLKLGLDRDPSYRNQLLKLDRQPAGARRMEMARRVFNTQIAATINIMPRDAREYYDKNADIIATELHLAIIKYDNRQDAEDALKKIRSGEPFESVARSAMAGNEQWDLGFVKWANVPVDFVTLLYQLKPGEVSDILGSHQTGFQIVKLLASRKIARVDYSQVSAVVTNRLQELRLLEAYNQYVDQLRKNAKIEKL